MNGANPAETILGHPGRTAADGTASLRGADLLKEVDLSVEQWRGLLDLTGRLKAERYAGGHRGEHGGGRLAGRTIALLFEKASTRTRCAFEVAAHDEGAHVTYLDPESSHVGHKESVADTARVLSRMYDGIEYRGFDQGTVETLARYADVPVWNGLTDQWHPTQSLCDTFTMLEHARRPAEQIAVAYTGDARNNVANSLLVAGAMMGMDVRIAAPAERQTAAEVMAAARSIAAETGARIHQTTRVAEAVEGVDFVYTDVWLSMGEPEDLWGERIKLLSPYRVDRTLMERTGNPNARFLHCLPALHGTDTDIGKRLSTATGTGELEVTDEVFESEYSLVFDQAENRLHTIKAVLVATLGE